MQRFSSRLTRHLKDYVATTIQRCHTLYQNLLDSLSMSFEYVATTSRKVHTLCRTRFLWMIQYSSIILATSEHIDKDSLLVDHRVCNTAATAPQSGQDGLTAAEMIEYATCTEVLSTSSTVGLSYKSSKSGSDNSRPSERLVSLCALGEDRTRRSHPL